MESIRHQIVAKGCVLSVPNEIPSVLSAVIRQGLILSRQQRNLKLSELNLALQKAKVGLSITKCFLFLYRISIQFKTIFAYIY